MDLNPYVAALRDDLAAAAAVGDEATARAGSTLATALEPAMRLALMNALSDLAGEIDGALPDHRVGLRLRGREVDVSVDTDRRDGDGGAASTPGGFFAGPSSSPFTGPAGPGGSWRDRPAPGTPGGPAFPGGQGPGGAGGQAFSGGFGGAGGPGGFGGAGGQAGEGPDVGDISRMTLRIVDQIKGQAERAAAAQGMSLNSWVSQAVQGALRAYTGDAGGWGSSGSSGSSGPSGSDRPERARWSGGRPVDEDPPGDQGPSTPGSPESPGSPGSPRRDDGPEGGDGGVQGWVRG